MDFYSESSTGRVWSYTHPSGYYGIVREEFYYQTKKVRCRTFSNSDGVPDRDPADGPAFETFYENGQTSNRCFMVNGEYHRELSAGPAIERFDSKGNPLEGSYYTTGKKVRKRPLYRIG